MDRRDISQSQKGLAPEGCGCFCFCYPAVVARISHAATRAADAGKIKIFLVPSLANTLGFDLNHPPLSNYARRVSFQEF